VVCHGAEGVGGALLTGCTRGTGFLSLVLKKAELKKGGLEVLVASGGKGVRLS